MISKELLAKVKQIEITTSRLVTDVFAGEYHSVFKGQGMEFDEVREYQIGDDVRTIDWNVTARTGRPHIKKFVEERELTVMIMVDVSASHRFASVNELKSELAAQVSALLALSAIGNNDKVGLIIFTDTIEKFIPPRKGRKHVLRIIREVLYFEPQGKSTDLIQALEYLRRVTTRKSISFLVSDFFIPNEIAEDLKKVLKIVNKRHDLIAISLNDPKEQELNDAGLLLVEDAETGENMYVDSTSLKFRMSYKESNRKRIADREELFRSIGMDYIDLSTDRSFADDMVKFFFKRKARR